MQIWWSVVGLGVVSEVSNCVGFGYILAATHELYGILGSDSTRDMDIATHNVTSYGGFFLPHLLSALVVISTWVPGLWTVSAGLGAWCFSEYFYGAVYFAEVDTPFAWIAPGRTGLICLTISSVLCFAAILLQLISPPPPLHLRTASKNLCFAAVLVLIVVALALWVGSVIILANDVIGLSSSQCSQTDYRMGQFVLNVERSMVGQGWTVGFLLVACCFPCSPTVCAVATFLAAFRASNILGEALGYAAFADVNGSLTCLPEHYITVYAFSAVLYLAAPLVVLCLDFQGDGVSGSADSSAISATIPLLSEVQSTEQRPQPQQNFCKGCGAKLVPNTAFCRTYGTPCTA